MGLMVKVILACTAFSKCRYKYDKIMKGGKHHGR